MESFLRELKVVNDFTERLVKYLQDYKNVSKRFVVSDHRPIFKDISEKALVQAFQQ